MLFDRPNRRSLPLRSLAPNILTVLGLCAGLTGVQLAIHDRFDMAVLAIAVASIIDTLDGRVARLLKGTSKFGAELDSLSDFVNFGVTPALILYLWTLENLGGLGWIIVLGFAVCAALRLARFNTALEEPDKPAWSVKFFTGVPAPAGACLSLLPIALYLVGWEWLRDASFLIGIYTCGIAFLMISRIPTFSLKRAHIGREMVLPILLIAGVSAAAVVGYPWLMYVLTGLAYLALIPFSVMSHRRHAEECARPAPAPVAADELDLIR
ncbi:MAG: CDP-diacylglycerol--serine O-phosphatidyltransferase [Alphaproteobacteria bacterium]